MNQLQMKDPSFVSNFHERVGVRRLDFANVSIDMEYSFSTDEEKDVG